MSGKLIASLVVNKKLLNKLPAPLAVGSIQFLVGALYSSLLWMTGLRAAPKLTASGRSAVRQIGFWHSFGQLMTMLSLQSAPVSFTHIVKALEPFFSALASALVFGKWMKPQVYAALIPVVCGVGYACMNERYFSWLAFWTAMLSNVSFALRAVSSKSAMTNSIGENITSANLFGLVTWMAFFVSVPMFLIQEGTSFLDVWKKATEDTPAIGLARDLVVSGLFHYLNNEVMYLALSNVHPVTLAVGNTMKRVFILVASVMVFRNPISFQAGLGSAVGISGVLLYSLTKQHYEKVETLQTSSKKGRIKINTK
jgi:solute carrier family 35 protein E1